MKKIAILFLIIAFASCSNNKPKDPNTAIFIEEQLLDFIKYNPDWAKDKATEEATTEKFKHKLINLSNEPDFLKNMPFQLKGISDTVINEQTYKIATFKTYDINARPANSLLNYMDLQINGLVSPAQVRTLKIGKNYTLSGTLYKQGKRADVKFIHEETFNAYDLGKYTFSITDFKKL